MERQVGRLLQYCVFNDLREYTSVAVVAQRRLSAPTLTEEDCYSLRAGDKKDFPEKIGLEHILEGQGTVSMSRFLSRQRRKWSKW